MQYEIRSSKTHVHLRGRQLVGLAAPYGVPTEIRTAKGAFTEVITPGAFSGILAKNPEVICNVNHNDAMVLGNTASGTLTLQEDHRGLNFAVELADTDYAKHVHAEVERGDLRGCSFAFITGPENEQWAERSGKVTREITGFSALHDVAIVTRPAYPGTEVDARQLTYVSPETRSVAEQFIERGHRVVHMAFEEVMKQSADFVIDQLHVPLQWDSNLQPRPVEDQLKLMRLAVTLHEIQEQGWNVDVVRDDLGDGTKWPRIVYAGPTKEEKAVIRRRQRYLRDFLLN